MTTDAAQTMREMIAKLDPLPPPDGAPYGCQMMVDKPWETPPDENGKTRVIPMPANCGNVSVGKVPANWPLPKGATSYKQPSICTECLGMLAWP